MPAPSPMATSKHSRTLWSSQLYKGRHFQRGSPLLSLSRCFSFAAQQSKASSSVGSLQQQDTAPSLPGSRWSLLSLGCSKGVSSNSHYKATAHFRESLYQSFFSTCCTLFYPWPGSWAWLTDSVTAHASANSAPGDLPHNHFSLWNLLHWKFHQYGGRKSATLTTCYC